MYQWPAQMVLQGRAMTVAAIPAFEAEAIFLTWQFHNEQKLCQISKTLLMDFREFLHVSPILRVVKCQ